MKHFIEGKVRRGRVSEAYLGEGISDESDIDWMGGTGERRRVIVGRQDRDGRLGCPKREQTSDRRLHVWCRG